MKLIYAARFAAVVFLVAILYILFILTTPLAVTTDWALRSGWLATNRVPWLVGGWLALLAVFAWMVLLVALMHAYTPVHRISTMLQSGLIGIGAVLLVVAIVIWMNLLLQAADGEQAAFVDGLALSLLGAGFLMGGGVTAWIAIDLALLQKLPRAWLLPGLLAGLLAIPSPFLLPNKLLLVPAVALFFVWSVLLGMQRTLPAAYTEMSGELLRPLTRP
jgi:hypothetical protein